MRGFTLLGKEFTEIIKSKKILIPIIAVLFVPLLYAGMFLWAFWDPYEQLDDLPVAVVNLDKGAVFDGKPIEVGKGLVDELKDNKSFKWEFVSEKTAKEGMENRKYYMLVRIPENFSDNATTLLKENPRPLNLEYIPNESLNFLSSQIGGTAIEKIKGEVSNTLTKTYAEKMFDSIKDVSKGFADGADGANKLHDGSVELQDGSSKVTEGLHTLQGKSGEMTAGIHKLLDGSEKVTDGSSKVTNGLNILSNKSQAGIGELSNGSSQIYQNLQVLASKSLVFDNGLQTVSTGSSKLQEGMDKLTKGLGQLQGGQGELGKGAQAIQKGINDLDNGLKKSSDGVTAIQNKLPELTKGTEDFSSKASQFAQGVEQWQQKATELSEGSEKTAKGAENIAAGLEALGEQIKNLPDGEAKQQLQATVEKLGAGSKEVVVGTKTVMLSAQGLANKSDEIKSGASKLAGGAKTIHDGQVVLQTGVDELQAGQIKLVEGADKLADGQQEFMKGFQTFGTKLGETQEGATELVKGSTELNKGVKLLATGSPQLVDGVNKLATGAGKLGGGLEKLSSELNNGVSQLADGSSQVTDGSNQVTIGLGTLSNGSGKLIDGVNQLADGSGKVTDGLVKVNDGTGELATKLGEGAEKTGKVKGTDKTYNMFADPVKVQTEKMSEVPNYGTGFTPYFLSLGLFVGALLLSIVYPLRDTVGVPKSGFSWFISKFGVLLSVGIIQALVADLVLLLGLGVEVQSVPYFILFSILTSLAFIALIQCLVTAFGDAGRFIAILTLIMQLTTSAGTFPLELIPKFLQHFNAWLPMTYSVSGFKAVVSSGDFGFMWQNAGILTIFIVLLSLGTIGSLTWMHKRQFQNLVEEKSIEA
ncbi:phage infection protein [Bacillus pseudomycoides]|uniref:YhgE/Pip domain-containing protein n=1 Tax=Bacillus pseudomycoides TaxID=64104 RepID=UPI000BECAFAB|nr:YhgE/Pip domain-containing protein [Bacillus pseudomycoides]PDX99564.1 phage infection protein [Bacillus pseudomycoides]PEK78487.1 phage infection protein [Bacillus pseudomycoides]PEN01844.1 phage infection protein [Bacillus pseudomycoides]PGB78603.1 phage infection protein [Bacillus pseudomycoides]PHE54395.1 phage infection protein [Bacillus pseudomycoides]